MTVLASQLAFHGRSADESLLEVGPRAGEDVLRTEDVIAAIDRAGPSLALVLLPGVQYLTGQVLEIAAISASARAAGARIGWDLAHAIGNVPLALHDSGADFAVWCSYKYLCGGPGAVAGAWIHARHAHDPALPRFSGWWGHDAPSRLDMPKTFVPMAGAEGWQLSNPPVLALAPLAAALGHFDAAGMGRLREKSLALGRFAQSEKVTYPRSRFVPGSAARMATSSLILLAHWPYHRGLSASQAVRPMIPAAGSSSTTDGITRRL